MQIFMHLPLYFHEQNRFLVIIVATIDIQANEEIILNYGNGFDFQTQDPMEHEVQTKMHHTLAREYTFLSVIYMRFANFIRP